MTNSHFSVLRSVYSQAGAWEQDLGNVVMFNGLQSWEQ